jgi:3-oxoacyl-[acyl-carrier-protein] synthase III
LRATPNPRVQLTGTGSCVGPRVLQNADLEPLVHGYDPVRSGPFGAWVDQVTHIHERPWLAPGMRGPDLSLVAARNALEMAGVAAIDLDLIIYASFTLSQTVPGDHCILAHELGANKTASFNLMGACSGSIHGLAMAYGMIASGTMRHVLVVGCESISAAINFYDPLTAILFGDGAGAALVSRVEGAPAGTGMLPPCLGFEWVPNAIQVENANNPHNDLRCHPAMPDRPNHELVERSFIVMNGGPNVLKNAVHAMTDCTVRTLGYETADLKNDNPELRATLDSAWLVPHQANGRIIDGLAKQLAMPKVIKTVYRYGNMSAASNLIALDYGMRRGTMERVLDADGRVLSVRDNPTRYRRGDLVMLPSIGGGYLMGCVGLKLGLLGI